MKCVYLRTNLVNGKQYVGQTVNFKNREYDWKCLKAIYANKYLSNARAKRFINLTYYNITPTCH